MMMSSPKNNNGCEVLAKPIAASHVHWDTKNKPGGDLTGAKVMS